MLDFWFQMGITIVKGTLAGLHVDPSKAATLKSVLLDLANSILAVYGLPPVVPPAAS